MSGRGLPHLTILSSAVLWLDVHVWSDGHRDLANAIYLLWAVPTTVHIARLLWDMRDARGTTAVQPIG